MHDVVAEAAGVPALLQRLRLAVGVGGKLELLAQGPTDATGLLNRPELSKTFRPGGYVAVFHVADFYRAQGVALPAVPFLDLLTEYGSPWGQQELDPA